MQPLHMPGHRRLSGGSHALEKDALQLEFCDAQTRLDLHGHFEQAIRLPDALLPGRVAAPHDDGLRSLGDNFEVVRDLCPDLVRRVLELLPRPQLVFRGLILVLLSEV